MVEAIEKLGIRVDWIDRAFEESKRRRRAFNRAFETIDLGLGSSAGQFKEAA